MASHHWYDRFARTATAPQPAAAQLRHLGPHEAQARLDAANEAILLDVRTHQEWLFDGFIEGATLIPMDDLLDRAEDELPRDAEIIVYCAHGVRSEAVSRFLLRQGYGRVSDITGGIAGWIEAGLPIKRVS